jgi:hypothetical protein
MAIFIVLLIIVVALAIVVFRRTPFDLTVLSRPMKWLFYAALILIALYAGFWLTFGIGEMASGDMSGASHLVPAAALILVIWFAIRRPFEVGIGLTILGLLACGFFLASGGGGWRESMTAMVYGGLPFIVAGVLLLLAVKRLPTAS